jgi:hypothetical protein
VRFQNSFLRTALRRSVACPAQDVLPQRASAPRKRWAFLSSSRLWFFFFSLSALLAASGQAATFDPTVYHSYTATEFWAYDLAAQYPNLVKVVKYGESSYLHNPLFALEITANVGVNDPSKADFLFSAGIHAREVIGSEAAIAIANDLVTGYNSANTATRSKYQNMLAGRDVWIIPQQNPDGRLKVEGGLTGHRKNWDFYPSQSQNDTTRGVDLNRNYPHQWSLAESTPFAETYRGPRPLSEAESSSLWSFLQDTSKFSNLLCAVDIHSGVQQILTPWTSPNDPSPALPAADAAKFTSLKTALGQITGLSTAPYGSPVYGCLSDSIYDTFHAYAMTEEIYSGVGDIYSVFNPTTISARDLATKKAVDSALYLLSDAAFTVPEPSTFVLLAAAGLALLAAARRRIFV